MPLPLYSDDTRKIVSGSSRFSPKDVPGKKPPIKSPPEQGGFFFGKIKTITKTRKMESTKLKNMFFVSSYFRAFVINIYFLVPACAG
jgi:hypothetical protein